MNTLIFVAWENQGGNVNYWGIQDHLGGQSGLEGGVIIHPSILTVQGGHLNLFGRVEQQMILRLGIHPTRAVGAVLLQRDADGELVRQGQIAKDPPVVPGGDVAAVRRNCRDEAVEQEVAGQREAANEADDHDHLLEPPESSDVSDDVLELHDEQIYKHNTFTAFPQKNRSLQSSLAKLSTKSDLIRPPSTCPQLWALVHVT